MKVSPVSSTSILTPSSASLTTSTPRWLRISFISFNFLGFCVANTSFMLYLPRVLVPFFFSLPRGLLLLAALRRAVYPVAERAKRFIQPFASLV